MSAQTSFFLYGEWAGGLCAGVRRLQEYGGDDGLVVTLGTVSATANWHLEGRAHLQAFRDQLARAVEQADKLLGAPVLHAGAGRPAEPPSQQDARDATVERSGGCP